MRVAMKIKTARFNVCKMINCGRTAAVSLIDHYLSCLDCKKILVMYILRIFCDCAVRTGTRRE